MASWSLPRLAALVALTIAATAVLILILSTGSAYVLHAEFSDAGQLVKDDPVMIAGHHVGSIAAIKLTDNGLADIELDISDDSVTPLRTSTIASIGQLSLTGVANRFVSLAPGPGQPIPSGGTLPPTQTRGIVDLDALLDSLTPQVRASIQRLLSDGAYVVSQPTASQLNEGFRYLDPAFSQIAGLGSEVVADRLALDRLVSSTAVLATKLASRNSDLGAAVTNTAAALREVATERSALEDTLTRAPAVLHQATGTLHDANATLISLDPMLLDLQPVAPRLARLLTAVVPAARNATPVIEGVQSLVPNATAALRALPAAVRKAIPAVRSLTATLIPVTPILAGTRPYAPDVVAGFFNGVGGAAGGNYDANGHYLKNIFTVQGGGSSLSGLLSLLGSLTSSAGRFGGARTGLLAPCPGGGGQPAADLSNPWTTPDVPPGAGNICDPAHDQR